MTVKNVTGLACPAVQNIVKVHYNQCLVKKQIKEIIHIPQ